MASRRALVPFLALLGCGGAPASAPVLVVAPASASAPAPAPTASAPAPAPVADSADPAARPFLLAHLAAPSVAPLQAAPPRVLAMALANTELGEVAGMRTGGAPLLVLLHEGERLTIPVALGPADCATFLAQGGLGVVEVDLFLTQGSGDALRVLAEDLTAGPIAVLGGRRGCFAPPGGAPLAAELHAVLRRGSGQILVQSYRR